MVDYEYIKSLVRKLLIENMAKQQGIYYVPVAVSNRHIHISEKDLYKLFGDGHNLTLDRYLSQPEQFACLERLTIVGPKGKLNNVRILGPTRKDTQVEISITDGYLLGIEQVVRMSGDVKGTPGCKLIGPRGELELLEGVIVSERHLHMSEDEAKLFGLKNGDIVKAKKTGIRSTVFENVVVRCGKNHKLEMHIDTDEANSAKITNGDILTLEKDAYKDFSCDTKDSFSYGNYDSLIRGILETKKSFDMDKISNKYVLGDNSKLLQLQQNIIDNELILEKDVDHFVAMGIKEINCKERCVITPLAKDRAREKGLKIIRKH